MPDGIFITLEGGEGVGKSTLARALGEELADLGRPVVLTREPGGSPVAETVRELVLHSQKLGRRTQSLLFAAARADHVETLIRPALSRGAIVICDRFIDSTWAYQGGQDGLSDRELESLETLSTCGLVPDLTIVLDGDPKHLLARRASRGADDAFERKPISFHNAIRQRFLERAQSEKDRIVVIDAERSQADVLAATLEVIRSRLGGLV